MKKLIPIYLLTLAFYSGHTQSNTLPSPEPYFDALIVNNIDTSLAWYTEVLGYNLIEKNDYPDMRFKQANLKSENAALELLEIDSALDPRDIVPNYNSKTKMIGLFKIGYAINGFDDWLNHLRKQNVQFHGSVVLIPGSDKRMVIIKDPDGNRIQLFEK